MLNANAGVSQRLSVRNIILLSFCYEFNKISRTDRSRTRPGLTQRRNPAFENLDIHWKRPIVLDIERFYSKIVGERRGGFCYELNGLFNELLISIGFTTRLISARVGRPDGSFGPEFDHAAIIVSIGDEDFLADVGFGDFAAEPLRLVVGEEQQDTNGVFVIERGEGETFVVKKMLGGEWKNEYLFTDIARELAEFAEMCDFQQFSPESHFTKGKLCSIMTETGRKTMTEQKYFVTMGETRHETPIGSPTHFDEALRREFGIRHNN
ncbi:MAG TPA: arylamine N-acetyltransferase [Pyrinomonadaceae bacterium]|nr:arylamine N-acetyltransferase [Pyrinomonadaceae bacterium]